MSELNKLVILLVVFSVAAAIFGLFFGLLLRRHHNNPVRVGLGAACFMALLYLLIIAPGISLKNPHDGGLNILAMIPGMILVTALTAFEHVYRLPVIGGPMLAWMLAMTRRQAANATKYIAKLEMLETERRSTSTRRT